MFAFGTRTQRKIIIFLKKMPWLGNSLFRSGPVSQFRYGTHRIRELSTLKEKPVSSSLYRNLCFFTVYTKVVLTGCWRMWTPALSAPSERWWPLASLTTRSSYSSAGSSSPWPVMPGFSGRNKYRVINQRVNCMNPNYWILLESRF